MQTDKKTAELIAELGLHQEKGKAGWKLRIRPDGLPWKKHGLGTQILEEAIQEAHAAHDNYERWIFKRTGFKIVSAFGWEMLTNEYLETLDLWRKRKTKTRIGLTNRGRDNIQRCLRFFRDFINEKLPLSCTKADLSAYYRNGLKTKRQLP